MKTITKQSLIQELTALRNTVKENQSRVDKAYRTANELEKKSDESRAVAVDIENEVFSINLPLNRRIEYVKSEIALLI